MRTPVRLLALAVCALGAACGGPTTPTGPVTIEIQSASGATGSGTVSAYFPRFQPGAEHLGTCVLQPGSNPCTISTSHRSGTIELVAGGAVGSDFAGWGLLCAAALSNTSCTLSLDTTLSYSVRAAFSVPTTRVTLVVKIHADPGNASGVIRANQNPSVAIGRNSPMHIDGAWDFDLPAAGGNITLSVQPDPGSVVTLLRATIDLAQGTMTVCNNAAGFATSCTFQVRPADVRPPPGSLLDINVTLEEERPTPPPTASQRYVATSGRDGSNTCTNPIDPCLTMPYAIGVSATGDTINVAAGPYTGVVNVNKAVTLNGESRASTSLRGQFRVGGGVSGDLGGDISIEGFNIQSGSGATEGILLNFLSPSSLVSISQVDVLRFARGLDAKLSGGRLRVASSAFNSNTNDGLHIEGRGQVTLTGVNAIGNGGDGVQFAGVDGSTIVITGSRFDDNQEAGLQVEVMQGGAVSLSSSCVGRNGLSSDSNVRQAGVALSVIDSATVTANGNNIKENRAGGVSVTSSSTRPNFQNNWWNSPLGPSGGDSAIGNVDVSSPASTLVPGTPCS